jgi:hypothetical protein
MQKKLIDKIKLENGLAIELYDRSRRVAGDRWLVGFEARIDIGVKPEYFQGQGSGNPSFDSIREVLGEKITYSCEKSRQFIEETQKDKVLQGIKERFVETTLTYFSGRNFPRNMILSKYEQAQGSSNPRNRQ